MLKRYVKSKRIFFIILLSNIFFNCINVEALEKRISFSQVLQEQGISINGLEDFWLEKENSFGERKRYRRLLIGKDANGRIFRLEIISPIEPASTDKYIQDRRYVLESVFKSIPSPYPGEITHSIEVPEKFKPEIISLNIFGAKCPVYILYSSNRLTYGVGSEDLITYRGVLTFIYDEKKRTFYTLELFVPKKDFLKEKALDIIKSFKINNPNI